MRKPLLVAAIAAAAAIAILGAGTASAATEVTVTDKDAHGWEFTSETNTAGHVEFVLNGLQLKADTGSGSAAGFVPVSGVTLNDVAASEQAEVKFNPKPGTAAAPAFQIDLTSDRGWFRLVSGQEGDPKVWAATKSCEPCAQALLDTKIQTGAGLGYKATLDEWAAAVPGAKVTKIGFKFAGVQGQGVLSSLRFLGTTYRFGVARAAEPTTPTPDPTTTPAPAPPTADPRFATCSEANDAGVFDIPKSSPDYRAEMDSDHDGLACERPTAGNGGTQVRDVPTAINTGRR